MRTLNGVINEATKIADEVVLLGTIAAPVEVVEGGHLTINGTVTRDLTIGTGGSVELNGTAFGIVTNHGGRLVVRGIVYGRVITDADGETVIDGGAVITNQPIYPTTTVSYTAS